MLTDQPLDPVTMSDLDLTSVRSALHAELARGEATVRELEPRAIPHLDPVAYMTTVSTLRTMDGIRAALDRLARGTYGRCIRCGGAILAARLEVLPHAETCMECQAQVERT
jgi:DnaK suppressor protein